MDSRIKLTVFFEGMFWVGVFEKICGEEYEVAKVVFVSEPKDYDVYDFVLKNFNRLKFTNSLRQDKIQNKEINPKRLNREIKKEIQGNGTGTKAQIAMKLQQEGNKAERKKFSKEKSREENERKFQLKQEKKLKKHNGH